MDLDRIRMLVLQVFFASYKESPTRWVFQQQIIKLLPSTNKEYILSAIEFLEDEKYLKVKKTPTGRKKYKISNKGLQEFSPSKFKNKPLSGLSVNAKGGIFVFGDNLGVIKQETVQSFDEINELIKVIKNSNILENEKRQVIGDAETIKAQLTKPIPEKSIIKKAWETIEKVGSIKETVELIKTLADMLHPYTH